MSDNAQSAFFQIATLMKTWRHDMMFISARCNNAGPLGKPIPTRSLAATLLARLPVLSRLRW
jgi:hypothetical protein